MWKEYFMNQHSAVAMQSCPNDFIIIIIIWCVAGSVAVVRNGPSISMMALRLQLQSEYNTHEHHELNKFSSGFCGGRAYGAFVHFINNKFGVAFMLSELIIYTFVAQGDISTCYGCDYIKTISSTFSLCPLKMTLAFRWRRMFFAWVSTSFITFAYLLYSWTLRTIHLQRSRQMNANEWHRRNLLLLLMRLAHGEMTNFLNDTLYEWFDVICMAY